jgi:hypothetical protein
MMSVVATAVVLGVLVLMLLRTRLLGLLGAVVCVLFGLTLAATPVGPAVSNVTGAVGDWIYTTLQGM